MAFMIASCIIRIHILDFIAAAAPQGCEQDQQGHQVAPFLLLFQPMTMDIPWYWRFCSKKNLSRIVSMHCVFPTLVLWSWSHSHPAWYSSCPLHSWYLFHDEEVNLDALTGSFQTRLPECHGLIAPFHWVATTLGAQISRKEMDQLIYINLCIYICIYIYIFKYIYIYIYCKVKWFMWICSNTHVFLSNSYRFAGLSWRWCQTININKLITQLVLEYLSGQDLLCFELFSGVQSIVGAFRVWTAAKKLGDSGLMMEKVLHHLLYIYILFWRMMLVWPHYQNRLGYPKWCRSFPSTVLPKKTGPLTSSMEHIGIHPPQCTEVCAYKIL